MNVKYEHTGTAMRSVPNKWNIIFSIASKFQPKNNYQESGDVERDLVGAISQELGNDIDKAIQSCMMEHLLDIMYQDFKPIVKI